MAEPRVADGDDRTGDRLLDVALALARTQGVSKTTMAGLAKAAGCSRATLYRTFGCKRDLFEAVAHRELARFSTDLESELAGANTLEDALTIAVVEAHNALSGHAALQFVLANEPGVVLPFLGFGRVDQLYAAVRTLGKPHFTRFVGSERAGWVAEWLSRLVLSHLFLPRPDLNLADPRDARALVGLFVVPALVPPASPPSAPAAARPPAFALAGASPSIATQGS